MIATVEVENTAATTSAATSATAVVATATPVAAAVVAATSEVLVGHDVARERELDTMAASIEGAAEGLAVFLLLALFGLAFVVATLTGVLA